VDREVLKERIRAAFAGVEYPGDWCLRDSEEGDEPYLVERDFKGKTDRYALDAEFLDLAPDGFASALHFLSEEAFRFYLPAYLIADLDGKLEHVEPVFHLTHGLDEASGPERINPRRYGDRTWSDHARCRHAMFDPAQAAAIVGYLETMRDASEWEPDRTKITQALESYWYARARREGRAP